MVRRSGWYYYFRDAREKAGQAAEWMAAVQGWDAGKKAEELQRYERAVDGVRMTNSAVRSHAH